MSLSAPPRLRDIFLVFFKFGLTGFGGPAMITVIRELTVHRHRWVDEATFQDGLVLAQSVPGATAMQAAAYVGLSRRGVPGALCAYVGLGLPAFFLMLVLSAFYARTQSIDWMLALMRGLSVVVVALLGYAAWTFARVSCREPRGLLVALVSGTALGFDVNPFLVILGAAVAGLFLYRDRQPADVPKPLGNALAKGLRQALPLLCLLGLAMAATWFYDPGLFALCRLMLGINCVSFSGGFSALPIMYHLIVDVAGQMSGKTFMDGIALGQITPGPISITSTFLGYMLYGPVGATAATIAMFAPSFLILVTVAPSFAALKGSRRFFRATLAIAASFVGLLGYVTARFATEAQWSPAAVVLAAAALLALWRRVEVPYVVGFAALYSLVAL